MKAFSVTGLTGSGKTTVIEAIIKELCDRGYSVGSVKEIHFEAFRIDVEGKNTYRHRQAGSGTVTARAHHETDIMFEGHKDIYEVLANYKEDIIVLEGVRDAVVPEIAVSKEDVNPKISPLTVAVSGRFANNGISEYEGLPVIHGLDDTKRLVDLILEKTPELFYDIDPECCSECGYDCRGLLSEIIKGNKSETDCVLKKSTVSLKIDGQEVVIVPFVQSILRNTVLGVVKELKGYKENAKIEISLK